MLASELKLLRLRVAVVPGRMARPCGAKGSGSGPLRDGGSGNRDRAACLLAGSLIRFSASVWLLIIS